MNKTFAVFLGFFILFCQAGASEKDSSECEVFQVRIVHGPTESAQEMAERIYDFLSLYDNISLQEIASPGSRRYEGYELAWYTEESNFAERGLRRLKRLMEEHLGEDRFSNFKLTENNYNSSGYSGAPYVIYIFD